jgi:uncharacterized membrane protein
VVEQPSRIVELAVKAPKAIWYGLSANSDRNRRRPPDFPWHLCLREIAGMAVGPFAYLRTRRKKRAAAGSATDPRHPS